jgi:hypothetical protein
MTATIEPTVSGYRGTETVEGLGTMQAYAPTRELVLDRLLERIERAKVCRHIYYPSQKSRAKKCSACGIIKIELSSI